MDLDRGILAKIDRRVLAGLAHGERYQMVRLAVSEATWSAWKRYCQTLGISMGRGLAALLEHELRSVVDEVDGEPVFLARLESRVVERQAALDARQRQLDAREQALRAQKREIVAVSVRPQRATGAVKIGRNDPCPCGSGLKSKRCHGAS